MTSVPTQLSTGNTLAEASTPLTSMGAHTAAPNVLPAPSATAGATMGTKPGAKDPSQPGQRSVPGVVGR